MALLLLLLLPLPLPLWILGGGALPAPPANAIGTVQCDLQRLATGAALVQVLALVLVAVVMQMRWWCRRRLVRKQEAARGLPVHRGWHAGEALRYLGAAATTAILVA